ncbi:uncharacterized [Tachysurus ichikawai]
MELLHVISPLRGPGKSEGAGLRDGGRQKEQYDCMDADLPLCAPLAPHLHSLEARGDESNVFILAASATYLSESKSNDDSRV